MERIHRKTVLKNILMNQITTMCIVTQSQTFWSVKSSGPYKALLSIKLVEAMEFQQSYLKSWKTILWKCCTQNVCKFGEPSSGHRTGKGQSSSQFPRWVVLKNVQTTGQLHSSPSLVRSWLKSCMLGFSIMWNQELPDVQTWFRKEELEIKLPAFTGL